jgi:uncharacterized protein YkwD
MGTRLALVVSTALVLVLCAAAPAPAKPKPSSCSAKSRSFTAQVYCWIKAERSTHGRPAFKKNKRLARAARAQSKRMARRDVFSHELGGSIFTRVKRSGYLRKARSFEVGETIAWVEPGAGARTAIDTWLGSAYHRSILLSATLRDHGVGVVKGSPMPGRVGGHTVTVVYGRR